MSWKSVIVAGICMLFVNSFHCALPNLNGIEVIKSNGVIDVDVTTLNHILVNQLDPDIAEDARLKTVSLFYYFIRSERHSRY